MAGITKAQAEAQLALWLAADTAVATGGQSYSVPGRILTRADAAEITAKISYWERQVQRLSRGGIAIKGGTPC